MAENDPHLKERYLFNPYQINKRGEYYRFITGGFLHAGFVHLAFNMITLYSFGGNCERVFSLIVGNEQLGGIIFLVFYLSAIVVSDMVSYMKFKDFSGYRALGASGAVSAVVFAIILLAPLNQLLFFVIPMPSFIFGGLYMFYTYYMSKHGQDNIGHDAHFFGALYGIVFMIFMRPQAFLDFFTQIAQWKGFF
jgi:membrane associated rhomboid family serine protease